MERVLVTSVACKQLQLTGLGSSSRACIKSRQEGGTSPHAATCLLPEAIHGLQNPLCSSRGRSRRLVRTRMHFTRKFISVEAAVATEFEEVESGRDPAEAKESLPHGSSESLEIDDYLKSQALSYSRTLNPEPEVGKRWREIQGQNDWKGLLDPIDPLLRAEILRYGDYCSVTYDSFEYDKNAYFCGSCNYRKETLFEKVNLAHSGYTVVEYLYATATAGKGATPSTTITRSFNELPERVSLNSFFVLPERVSVNAAWDGAAWDGDVATNWVGYVAITTDENEIKRLGRRDILVAWRGTVTPMEWGTDFQALLTTDPRRKGLNGGVNLKVHEGFLAFYTTSGSKSIYERDSARKQLLLAIRRLVEQYHDEELSITVTGHSLGAAMAVLSAYDIAETGLNQPDHLPNEDQIKEWAEMTETDPDIPDNVLNWTQAEDVKTIPVTAFTFAGPRVGNKAFQDRVDQLQVKVLRMLNEHDVVPKVPLISYERPQSWLRFILYWMAFIRHWIQGQGVFYVHVGQSLETDNNKSPFLKAGKVASDLRSWEGMRFLYEKTCPAKREAFKLEWSRSHNLEALLHVLSGFHGKDKDFHQVIPRDIALVNKSSDILLEQFFVATSWWQQQNRGLIRFNDRGVCFTLPRSRENYPDTPYLKGKRVDAAFSTKALRYLAGIE